MYLLVSRDECPPPRVVGGTPASTALKDVVGAGRARADPGDAIRAGCEWASGAPAGGRA